MIKKIMSMFLVFVLLLINLPYMDTAYAKPKIIPMVTAGYNFSAVLKADGTVWCFGRNESGQLGNGTISYHEKPVKVLGLNHVTYIDSADDYTLALKSDGTVWGWGNNYERGLGIGKPLFCRYASKISGISDIKAIAAGNGMSIFVKKDGTVESILWEGNKASLPKKMNNLENIISVSCKNTCAIALEKNGTVWTWQWDYPIKNDGIVATDPVKVDLSEVKSIAAGAHHYIALKKDGSVWLWGLNTHGEIGDGSKDWCYSPKELSELKKVKFISAGAYESMAVLKDGTYLIWGNNEDGQYGNASNDSSLTPVTIDTLTDAVSVDGGYGHTIVLKSNGDVMVMGDNHDGLLGFDDTEDKLTPSKIMNVKDATGSDSEDDMIYPNGSLEDWKDAKPIATSTIPDNGEKQVGITKLYSCIYNDTLYLAATLTEGIPVDFTIFLNVNSDLKEDYSLRIRDDFFFNGYLYQAGSNIGQEIYCVNGDIVEIMIPLSELGSPETISVKAEYTEDKEKYSVNAEINNWSKIQ